MQRASREKGLSGAGEQSRSARKRRVIVDAAADAFLQNGYLGTSVDDIAVPAGVSKQTIYKHFEDKERLFAEMVRDTLARVGEPFFVTLDALDGSADLDTALRELARQLVAIVNEPRLLSLRRLVIGEAARFPELARLYYERGHGRTADALAAWFRKLSERRLMGMDDAQLAAQNFVWLVLGIPLNRAMFTGEDAFLAAELDRYADEAVRVFLAAYGKPRPDTQRDAG